VESSNAVERRSLVPEDWPIVAVVFEGSVALHHACGFRVVGVRERFAELDGLWRDAVLLERRSEVVY